MKKILSFTLALILCFPLCACMSKEESKFVGEYEKKMNWWREKETLIVHSDGTYTFIQSDKEYMTKDIGPQEGATYDGEGGQYHTMEEKGTWEIIDGMIVFSFVSAAESFYSVYNGDTPLRTEIVTSTQLSGKQYELKGVYLYSGNTKAYEKIS